MTTVGEALIRLLEAHGVETVQDAEFIRTTCRVRYSLKRGRFTRK